MSLIADELKKILDSSPVVDETGKLLIASGIVEVPYELDDGRYRITVIHVKAKHLVPGQCLLESGNPLIASEQTERSVLCYTVNGNVYEILHDDYVNPIPEKIFNLFERREVVFEVVTGGFFFVRVL